MDCVRRTFPTLIGRYFYFDERCLTLESLSVDDKSLEISVTVYLSERV